MGAKRRAAVVWIVMGALTCFAAAGHLPAQAPAAESEAEKPQSDPLAELSPENRALFDAMREAVQSGQDAEAMADGKKLLPALKADTPLANFVTQVTAGSAVETGNPSDALALIKPITDAHPNDWHAAALLARIYAESREESLRDQQIAHLIGLHKASQDPAFGKLHIFPIQKVKLKSGYAVFLYPFEPLKPHNSYLVALIYGADGKQAYRIELESDDVDQAFFKPKKPGERRFSIDTYHQSESNGKASESQALHGFIDGVFDYDTMRDKIVKTANGE